MDTTSIRQKLHSYLEVANDKKIKANYSMMEEQIAESMLEYSGAFKAELDTRQQGYIKGKEKTVAEAESKKRVKELLKSSGR